MVSRGSAKVSKLAYFAQSSARSYHSGNCPGCISTAWLVSLGEWTPRGDIRGASVVFQAVDVPCPGTLHCSHMADYIYDFCLTQMLVFLSLYVMLSIGLLLSILVCVEAHFLSCACLVSVQVSAPYVIAGSTQELYTCLFSQMARLLLKIYHSVWHMPPSLP